MFRPRDVLAFCNLLRLEVDFFPLGLSPNIYGRLLSWFLDGGSSELVQQSAVRIMGARLARVHVLILHVLVREPSFNLLIKQLNKVMQQTNSDNYLPPVEMPPTSVSSPTRPLCRHIRPRSESRYLA